MPPDFKYPETVTLLEVSGSYKSDWMPGNLSKAIGFLQNYLNEIPADFRDSAKIEISSSIDYDSTTEDMRIYYTRPATEEEIAKRMRTEILRYEQQKRWAEEQLARAKAQLERLK